MKTISQNRATARDLQAKRIRWTTGLPDPLAREVARIAFREVR